jgi:hypothetical protein
MKNRIVVLISAVWLVLSMTAYSQDEKVAPTSEQNQKAEAPQAPKRLYAALFVIDSMDCASEKQLDTFRSIVSSRMAQTGFSAINQDVVIEALRKKGLSLSPDTLGDITQEGTALSLSELMEQTTSSLHVCLVIRPRENLQPRADRYGDGYLQTPCRL